MCFFSAEYRLLHLDWADSHIISFLKFSLVGKVAYVLQGISFAMVSALWALFHIRFESNLVALLFTMIGLICSLSTHLHYCFSLRRQFYKQFVGKLLHDVFYFVYTLVWGYFHYAFETLPTAECILFAFWFLFMLFIELKSYIYVKVHYSTNQEDFSCVVFRNL